MTYLWYCLLLLGICRKLKTQTTSTGAYWGETLPGNSVCNLFGCYASTGYISRLIMFAVTKHNFRPRDQII